MNLTDHEIDLIEREYCSRSLANFVKRSWPVLDPGMPLIWGPHMDAICLHLEAITREQINRLLINVPPGTSKSSLVSIFWPAWEWGPAGMQTNRIIGASHEQGLAIRDSTRMRRLVTSEWYKRLWPIELRRDSNQKLNFENMSTGFRQACAVGSMTGKRGDRVIWDDPHSVEDTYSAPKLAEAERIFKETLPTRLVSPEKSAIVIVMQRITYNDISGIIIDEDYGYEHLCLPMEYEKSRHCKTSIGWEDWRKEEGELLFPERFPAHVVERDKKLMGSHAVAGQFQQRPSAKGGSVFLDCGINYYLPKDLPEKFDQVICSWDCTFKDTDGSDFVVGQVWGKRKANAYLLYQVRDRMSFTRTKEEVRKMKMLRDDISTILIEDKANGPAIIDALKTEIHGLKPVEPDGSKLARAHAITYLWEAGNIFLPHPDVAPWVKTLTDEISGFPFAPHDDQVDAMTQGIRYLYPLYGSLSISKSVIEKARSAGGGIAKVSYNNVLTENKMSPTKAVTSVQGAGVWG